MRSTIISTSINTKQQQAFKIDGIGRVVSDIVSVKYIKSPFNIKQECTDNARKFVYANSGSTYILGYCEGKDGKLFNHAWVQLHDGSFVDPTLKSPKTFIYYAIAYIPKNKLREIYKRVGEATIDLEDYYNYKYGKD